ncbi:MAG: GspH/FimT family protein, partial [Oleiphilaceae bacterium]|nr:GspH/FimT family protein [Oleiphilaceae bacterium]
MNHHGAGRVRQGGLTLLELLITLILMVLLLALAGPSIQALRESSERRSALLAVYQGLQFARQEAVRRNSSVTLCPLDEQQRCHGDWNQ